MSEKKHEKSDGDNKATNREEHGGWLYLTKQESVQRIIEALLNLPAYREFNQKELSEQAHVSRQSVSRHIDKLLELRIIKPVEDTSPQRYRFSQNSRVSKKIIELDAAVDEVRNSQSENPDN